jgi:type IV secretion system protein VirB4
MKRATQSAPVFPQRDALVRREFLSAGQIPYTAQVSEHVLRTKWGDYVQFFKLSGASFESADDEQINNWHERLAIALRNVASPNVALWTHVIRRRERSYPQGAFDEGFALQLNQHYQERISGERLMVNELYLATVYRSTTGVVTNWTSKILSRTSRGAVEQDLKSALEACDRALRAL